MDRQLTTLNAAITLIAILSVFTLIIGCGSSADLTTEMNGKWKNEQGGDTVDIHLAKESSSLTIDGHTFQGVVEKIDKGSQTVHVKVNTENGNTEMWSLHQVWNDNGSAFKLHLRRNGTTETLIPVGRS